MSNFINGRERLWLPKSSVKDRGGDALASQGETGKGDDRDRERWREVRVTQSVKGIERSGEEGVGGKWMWEGKGGRDKVRKRAREWRDEKMQRADFPPAEWAPLLPFLSPPFCLFHPFSISVSYQPQCGILSHQISSDPERRLKLLCQSYLKHIQCWGQAPIRLLLQSFLPPWSSLSCPKT